MTQALSTLAQLLRTLVSLGLLAALGIAGWAGYRVFLAHDLTLAELRERRVQVTELEQKLAAQQRQLLRLQTANRLLKVDRRVALLKVLDQGQAGPDGQLRTRVEFVETDDAGRPLTTARQFTLEGDVAYVDAWVIKFADEAIEQGDPLRSSSICFFRRVFGEHQQPSEGFVVDAVGSRPAAYSPGDEPSALERELWGEFWDYANDPEKAKLAGVRAAHGEAPYIKLRPGKQYRVELRSSGGLTITAENLAEPEIGPQGGAAA